MDFIELLISPLLGMALFTSIALADAPHELTLREALDFAQNYSSELKAADTRVTEAKSSVAVARSYYYPTLEAQATDSSGFPGSTSYLAVGGLMGSPYRSGLGAGVVFTETLYDFGRTSNHVQSLEHQLESQKQDTEISRYRLNQEVIQAYFSCTLNRSQKTIWTRLQNNADVVEREVDRFVQTGQRSVVDHYLAETQKQEARTAAADYETREAQSEKRLAVLMGVYGELKCPELPTAEDFGLLAPPAVNPLISRAQADLKAAQSQLSGARSEHLPTLVGMGSVGYLEDQRLVDHSNYSLGIGLSIPIFEGFRIEENVNRTAAQVSEKDFSLQASQQLLDNLNQQYDETIVSTRTRLSYLGPELKLANDAFNLAKKRYFSFQGDLLDVRAALANLTRVLLDENSTRARYLESKELKEILNGAK
jgi:outer membrane protein TolC